MDRNIRRSINKSQLKLSDDTEISIEFVRGSGLRIVVKWQNQKWYGILQRDPSS